MRYIKNKSIFCCIMVLILLMQLCGCTNRSASVESNEVVADNQTQIDIIDHALNKPLWSTENFNEGLGGYYLHIYLWDDEENITLELHNLQAPPQNRDAVAEFSVPIEDIRNGLYKTDFKEDGWGHSGTVSFTFKEDEILFTISDINYHDENAEVWGFWETEERLIQNPYVYDQINAQQEEHYEEFESPELTGIWAQLGISEDEFRQKCVPLTDSSGEPSSITLSPSHYEIAYGKDYYSKNPDEATIAMEEDRTTYEFYQPPSTLLEHYIERGYDYHTFEGFLNHNMYAFKGRYVIYEYTKELFENMVEYPNNYIGNYYALHMQKLPRNYLGSHSYYNGVEIRVTDFRDDPTNPNIMQDQQYLFYVLFNGTFVTYDGKIGLDFLMISLEKLPELN